MRNKYIKIAGLASLMFAIQLFAQNNTPTVESVTFAQRTDGSFIVDIYYDINDLDGNTMTVSMQVSNDNGATWNFSCNNITGDVGSGITNGTGKHIIWDFGAEHPETFGDQFKIKVLADDGINEMGVPCTGIPTVYDPRDGGKNYNTIQIGNQCWLKENLNVGTKIISDAAQTGFQQADNNIIEKYCYSNDETNCDTYGGLYEWTEAMQYVTTEGTQGICPNGWHIPTYAEMQVLQTYVNNLATKLIDENAKSGYTYTNETGFSALFAGSRYYYNGYFYTLDYYTYFWSSTEYSSSSAYYMRLDYDDSDVNFNNSNESDGYSVRCLKD